MCICCVGVGQFEWGCVCVCVVGLCYVYVAVTENFDHGHYRYREAHPRVEPYRDSGVYGGRRGDDYSEYEPASQRAAADTWAATANKQQQQQQPHPSEESYRSNYNSTNGGSNREAMYASEYARGRGAHDNSVVVDAPVLDGGRAQPLPPSLSEGDLAPQQFERSHSEPTNNINSGSTYNSPSNGGSARAPATPPGRGVSGADNTLSPPVMLPRAASSLTRPEGLSETPSRHPSTRTATSNGSARSSPRGLSEGTGGSTPRDSVDVAAMMATARKGILVSTRVVAAFR